MLTSLSVYTQTHNTRLGKLLSKIRRDSIEIYYTHKGDVKIKCIDYVQRTNNINWKKLDKIIGAQRSCLLCSKDVALNQSLQYKRFDDSEYKERLCTNMGITLANQLSKDNISVGIIDKTGAFSTLPQCILKYTDNVIVVTENIDFYTRISENLIEETGAVVRLSQSQKSLCDCKLIIAPHKVTSNEGITQNSLLLTAHKPDIFLPCVCVYDYVIDFPKHLLQLCPNGMDKTYFASALYSLLNIYQLGALVPRLNISCDGAHTAMSLKTLLLNIGTKT